MSSPPPRCVYERYVALCSRPLTTGRISGRRRMHSDIGIPVNDEHVRRRWDSVVPSSGASACAGRSRRPGGWASKEGPMTAELNRLVELVEDRLADDLELPCKHKGIRQFSKTFGKSHVKARAFSRSLIQISSSLSRGGRGGVRCLAGVHPS